MKKSALEYARRGWPIFPARADKTPYTKHGVIDATTDKTQVEEWWDRWPQANIALNVGDLNMMVLDLDPGHDFDELEKNCGTVPDTQLVASTPRGGSHEYYALAPGARPVPPSASKIARQVDVRSFNSYVLLPPSRTADGNYEWINQGKPATCTDEMYRVCASSGRAKRDDRDTWIIEPDLDQNIEAATRWLRDDAKVAIEGAGGDHTAYATFAMMKSFGISKELAFDLVWDHWNPRCIPPWGPDEYEQLQGKVDNAYQYNTSAPGNMTEAYRVARSKELFKPVKTETKEGSEYTAGRFRIVDREAMALIKPPKWLIEDLITEESYSILFGQPGSFKSFVALDIALTLATGFPAKPNWTAVDPGPVLYTLGEGRGHANNRVKAWERVHWGGSQATNFYLADPVPHVSENAVDEFCDLALIHQPDGFKLVILDTVGRAMQGLNENAQEHASSFTRLVERLQYNLGCSVLALHHSGHDAKDRSRGSSVFGADADTVLGLDRNEKEFVVGLKMHKQKDAPEWTTDRVLKLTKTEDNSLVVVAPERGERPAKQDRKNSRDQGKAAARLIVATVAEEILRENKLKEYTFNALALAVAHDERVQQGKSTVRQLYLTPLATDNDSPIRKHFHVKKNMWRFA